MIKTISDLKISIDSNINTNGVNGINGAILNGILNDMVDSLKALVSRIPPVLTPTGTITTIDWLKGTSHIINLGSSTGDVTASIDNAEPGGSYFIKIIQHASIDRDIIWPANITWPSGGAAPVITPGVGSVDIVALYFDGTDYEATFMQEFL